jgi:wobble nucleotide-excising tRNase
VSPVDTRGGASCTYNVLINNVAIPIGGGNPAPGAPSFRNTLSSGDRSTLALAFFFAALDQDPDLDNKVVVIDDPITSLDDHRSLTTVQEMRRLAETAAQVIVLSHSKPFLCSIWQGADKDIGTAIRITRDGNGSTVQPWNVNEDCITEHDRRHALLRNYIDSSVPDNRKVAEALRPVIEAFVRVAYPENFPPGSLLGPFLNICEQRLGTPRQILDQTNIQELKDLLEYANRFHHDSNPAWETAVVNDNQLLGFVRRTLAFTRR